MASRNRTERQLGLYTQMIRMMLWEQKLLWLIDEGKVSGFFHAGRGQEAIPAGACAPLLDDDYIMYAHRGCGYMIAKGLSMEKLFGDFLGFTEGTTRGLGAGIVHIAWPDLGILGQSGTLGGCFHIAAGAGLSAKYRGTDQVTVCFFGDGTANRGTFHEALNVAALWDLPVVYLCENNFWATSVSAEKSTSVKDIAQRATAYDIPGEVIDGQDAEAVQDAVAEAVTRARDGQGPTLIEAKTYRYRGHYEGDPATYRQKEDLEAWKQRDPIEIMRKRLLESDEVDEGTLQEIRAEATAEVDEAADKALTGSNPDPSRIYEDIYA